MTDHAKRDGSGDPSYEGLLTLVADLERALEAEAAALAAGDASKLLDALDAKRRALARVEAGMRSVADARIASDALCSALERCRRLNDAAGGAIATAKRRNEACLELLGFAVQPEVYGPAHTSGAAHAHGSATAPSPQVSQSRATMPFWTA